MREIKSLMGLRVLSVEKGANLGTVRQVVVDLARGVLLGLILGEGAAERGVRTEDIATIGDDVIMTKSQEAARPLSELPELEERRRDEDEPMPIFTNTGHRLGVISAIFIDPYDRVVTRYEVSGGPIKDLTDGVLILPILPGTVHGRDAVIVPEEQVRQLGRATGGLRQRLSQWACGARKQIELVSEKAEKVIEAGSELVKKEAEVVKEKAAKVSERAEEIVHTGAEALKEQTKTVQEKAAAVSAKAKEAVAKIKEHENASGEAEAPEAPEEASAEDNSSLAAGAHFQDEAAAGDAAAATPAAPENESAAAPPPAQPPPEASSGENEPLAAEDSGAEK